MFAYHKNALEKISMYANATHKYIVWHTTFSTKYTITNQYKNAKQKNIDNAPNMCIFWRRPEECLLPLAKQCLSNIMSQKCITKIYMRSGGNAKMNGGIVCNPWNADAADLTTLCKLWSRWEYPTTHDDGPIGGTSHVTASGCERVRGWSGRQETWERRLDGQRQLRARLGLGGRNGPSLLLWHYTRSSLALPSHGLRFLVGWEGCKLARVGWAGGQ